MNVSFVKLKGVITELRLLRSSIDRIADLYELDLQHTKGITTRVIQTPRSEVNDSQVAYTEPGFAELVTSMERQAGRELNEDEIERVQEAFAAEGPGDE